MAGHAGNVPSSFAVKNTIERFRPSYLLLVGIAGGVRNGLKKGDVVVSSHIYGYEYGKIDTGFIARPDNILPCDVSLVTAAQTLNLTDAEWQDALKASPPEPGLLPSLAVGPVGSGDKVVDDLSYDLVKKVLQAWPDIAAVEMEGFGAISAINDARDIGRSVGFAMIRGVSDIPPSDRSRDQRDQEASRETKQSSERQTWKRYAANSAAAFVAQLIKVGWPQPPRPLPFLTNGDDSQATL
jgi:nucleoside phosphorylase